MSARTRGPKPPPEPPTIRFDLAAECCGSCKFFRHDMPAPIQGWCARRSPTVFMDVRNPNSGYWSRFPPMTGNGWCGEYERKEKLDA